ncbi:PREDICTED: tumor necrosis factor ligand superfamily member 13B [Nanorana parkeri]|uniref:tumor necrosis factor ligand superfamily member 13B n=1 Tax=Nanorana parkeri TaxID=125878 RepID=UPI0008540305|nr:PREDICTED: tumor necrosis factor ligand superfamily member 13B [Nanorana parkeri]
MDSQMMAKQYFPPAIERKSIYFYYYYIYPKGVLLVACLPFIILLFTGLTALLIYNVIALRTELENLRAELTSYRKPDIPLPPTLLIGNKRKGASSETYSSWTEEKETGKSFNSHEEDATNLLLKSRSRRYASEGKTYPSCLQLIPDKTRNVENEDDNTIIPWILSVRLGTALEEKQNKILIKENGIFFIYSQVWYTDDLFAMGHVIQRKKMQTVGNDPNVVTLFRCIQNMPKSDPNNSCFTGGLAKLEEGDELSLKVSRSDSQIFLSGDGTFFGAIKLF